MPKEKNSKKLYNLLFFIQMVYNVGWEFWIKYLRKNLKEGEEQMVFSSLVFLFVFLPVVLTLYYISSKKYKNYLLLLASLFFYA